MTHNIPIAFDVLGTCYGLDAAIEAIESLFGEQLIKLNISAKLLTEDWFHTTQRDFTYASMNGGYQPIFKMFTANLPRILLIAGVVPNTGAALFTAPELLPIVMTLTAMTARPSLAGCSSLLHSIPGRFQLMAATNGGDLATRGLFKRALGEEEAGKWKYFSCDSIQLAKPDPKVYDAIWAGFEGGRQSKGWFIASHTWDLFAAQKAGFKTAWVSYEEIIPMNEIYGYPDVVAVDLEDAARQIIALEY